MAITVRHLQDSDILESPRWRMGSLRPNNSTTLVAIDPSGKVRGISWMAYGGPVAMIGIWFHADPQAMIPLAVESIRFAKSCGCAMLLAHMIEDSRLLQVLSRRGWTVNTSFKSVAIGKLLL